MSVQSVFYKGPIICCEYFNENYILIGSGPYLSVVDANTLEIIHQSLLLKYRLIWGILIHKSSGLVCVYGEKALCFCTLDVNTKQIIATDDTLTEIDDLMWTLDWLDGSTDKLAIVCAHNQTLVFDRRSKSIEKTVFCKQKCMIYSAKVLNLPHSKQSSVYIASGTIFNKVLIWDSTDGEILCELSGHQGVIFNIGFDLQTRLLYSVSDDRSVIIWHIEESTLSGQLHSRFYGHEARVWKCVWLRTASNDKLYLCSIGEDLKCCIWDVNEKKLFYRFNTIRKGSKNIWSLCIDEKSYNLVTGWQDGGLRKYELKWYLEAAAAASSDDKSLTEMTLNYESEKDYARTIEIVGDESVCCTNNGYVYSNGRLIFQDENLASYNCMAKTRAYLSIGTATGRIYLLRNGEIKCVECVDEQYKDEKRTKYKIFSLLWSSDLHLLVSFTFLDGLLHLYHLNEEKFDLELTATFTLPVCKHRWVTSFALTSLNNTVYMFIGDKCGNLNVYKQAERLPVAQMSLQNSSINGIYFKHPNQVICCSSDGFYYHFKFTDGEMQLLELINKYELNSSIDLLQRLIFDDDFTPNHDSFDIEQNLLLALCFYGDKFLLWNFQLNRSLVEIKCGGANRSWSCELEKVNSSEYSFKLVFLKQKSIMQFNKKFHLNELLCANKARDNHLLQVFHGNNIACCLYFDRNHLFTGSEDTRVIASRLHERRLVHTHHLQGHDSVVKCMCTLRLSTNTYLLVTAGGKANMKIWKIVVDEEASLIKQIIQVCEFKRFTKRATLDTSQDVRFMHSDIYKDDSAGVFIYFACSDGFIRIFRYDSSANKVKIVDSCQYDRCLLCLKRFCLADRSYILASSTDGHLLIYQLSTSGQLLCNQPVSVIKSVHQSGINSFDIWNMEESVEVLVASVGDDSSLSIQSLTRTDEIKNRQLIKLDMIHGSSIMGVRFLTSTTLITIAKDQRMNLWQLDYTSSKVTKCLVTFINVADISSMDVVRLNETQFQVAVVGSGLEILNISL